MLEASEILQEFVQNITKYIPMYYFPYFNALVTCVGSLLAWARLRRFFHSSAHMQDLNLSLMRKTVSLWSFKNYKPIYVHLSNMAQADTYYL